MSSVDSSSSHNLLRPDPKSLVWKWKSFTQQYLKPVQQMAHNMTCMCSYCTKDPEDAEELDMLAFIRESHSQCLRRAAYPNSDDETEAQFAPLRSKLFRSVNSDEGVVTANEDDDEMMEDQFAEIEEDEEPLRSPREGDEDDEPDDEGHLFDTNPRQNHEER